MYMSRVTLRAEGSRLVEAGHSVMGGGYRIHQALWRLFGDEPNANRDFLYRQERVNGLPGFLMVSRRKPEDREGLWQVEFKEYHPKVSTGQRLAFSMRVNPVISRRDEAGRQHRHDVVMDLKRSQRDLGKEVNQAELVQKAMWSWLERRSANAGFLVDQESLLTEGYQQQELRKNKGQRIRFSSVDCSGILTVSDNNRFVKTLFHGIGPAKAFGCGLLLVRRP